VRASPRRAAQVLLFARADTVRINTTVETADRRRYADRGVATPSVADLTPGDWGVRAACEDAISRAAERLLGRCIASRARPQQVPHRAWDSRPVLI